MCIKLNLVFFFFIIFIVHYYYWIWLPLWFVPAIVVCVLNRYFEDLFKKRKKQLYFMETPSIVFTVPMELHMEMKIIKSNFFFCFKTKTRNRKWRKNYKNNMICVCYSIEYLICIECKWNASPQVWHVFAFHIDRFALSVRVFARTPPRPFQMFQIVNCTIVRL